MGSSHAATGVLTGVLTAAVVGSHPSDLFVCAAVGAGAALLPDLDEPGSSVGRSLGRVTETVASGVRRVSRLVYQSTGTAYELSQGQQRDGGHRHLTHTTPAVVVFGLLAGAISGLGGLGIAVVVFALSTLGLGVVLRPWGASAVQGAPVLGVLLAGAAVVLEGGSVLLVAVTVAVGALTHILGDWLTRSGVPLAWPFTYRGKRWWMFRSPLAFRTGQSLVEVAIQRGALVASVVVALAVSL